MKIILSAILFLIPTLALASSGGNATAFTTTGTGDTVFTTAFPTDEYAIQVVQTGTVTSWTAVLEGSLDCVTFTTVLTHDSSTSATGVTVFNGANRFPAQCFRAHVTALTLGAGTKITVRILGINSSK